MSTNDTWILVTVPGDANASVPLARRAATRMALLLLAWSGHHREQAARTVDLERVRRAAPAPRPFC